uniref:Costars domain-containing protein n=1 Tax=Glossina morsitans morsitans TaxID=37546 RepID=A0A1B0FDR1_GLOMM
MADISHELGALRFVVDSSLSSKVAMFNNQVQQHKQSQLLNPFSQSDGRASPRPTFSKEEYGKPLAGSLTEMRGHKANIHVLKEMLELCQIISSEGYPVQDDAGMRVIPFGELFNIYNYISDKVVGILLRARKHKLVDFEGEMLYQRRDDDVPIFLLRPIAVIRKELEEKMDNIKRAASPAPQATSVLLDRRAHGLDVPRGATPASRTPSPSPSRSGKSSRRSSPRSSKASSPVPESPAKSPQTSKATSPARDMVVDTKPPLPPSPQIDLLKAIDNLKNEKNISEPSSPQLLDKVTTDPNNQLEIQLNLPETPTPNTEPSEAVIKTDLNNNINNNSSLEVPIIVIENTATPANLDDNPLSTLDEN